MVPVPVHQKLNKLLNMKSGQLLLDFEKELKSKIKSATIESAIFDRKGACKIDCVSTV
jgi:hypothetical protein